MKYHIITYGCQMNRSDSERIAAVLENCGYSLARSEGAADLVVINVCSVRQSAIDRVYGKIKNLNRFKIKDFPTKVGIPTRVGTRFKVLLTGCILPKDKEKLKDKVDLIFDIKDLNKLPKLLEIRNWKLSRPKSGSRQGSGEIGEYLGIMPKYSTFPIAYVPIMTGCDNFCAYCVVPYTRGREISRPVKEIICEVKELIKRGCKMVILLGQNVNSYRSNKKRIKTNDKRIFVQNSVSFVRDSGKIVDFPKLLKMINDLPGDFWLSFITSHPKDLSDGLIETMTKCEKLMPYLHLPVQSGDNKILKKMNRHYTVAHYKNLIKKIRSKFVQIRDGFERNIAISTDIIVGSPGETKKQFARTAKLMREVKFDMAYLAKYSPRSGTAAAKLKDDVPQKEKERRWKILAKILEKTALEKNRKYLGKIVEVLTTSIKELKNIRVNSCSDSRRRRGSPLAACQLVCFGKTRTFKDIKIPINRESAQIKSQIPQIGGFVKVKIKKATPWGLFGSL